MIAANMPLGDSCLPGTSDTDVISLDTLPRHTQARVVDLVPASDAPGQALLLRLMEIGFLPGEPVRIVATGFPGSDPLAVRIGQATFALRRYEASLIRVSIAEAGV